MSYLDNRNSKKVLFINLKDRTFEAKTFPDLKKYIGGMGLGLSLFSQYKDQDPVVFSVGPLNGFFPFVSKTSIVLSSDGVVEDIYLGGSLSFRLAFSGFDAIVLLKKSDEKINLNIINESVDFSTASELATLGLPGKKSTLEIKEGALLDNYFATKEDFLGKALKEKNVKGLVVTGSKNVDIPNIDKYSSLFTKILSQSENLDVQMADNPSCSGCPLGCAKSQVGEMGGSILTHCLVACDYSRKIFSDANIVFSCLNVLGYDYTHEDIEAVPSLVNDLLKEL